MKAEIFFTLDSFNFTGPVDELIAKLAEASALISKMKSDKFISFSKTSDFYNIIVSMLYGPRRIPESGVLSSLVYDGKFSLATNSELDTSEIIKIVSRDFPVENQRWLSIFGALPDGLKIIDPVRNVNNEKDIIDFSKCIVRNSDFNADQYSEAFEGIYRGLIFHPDYNDLGNISGGVEKFLEGIFEMFDLMNFYDPEDGDPKQDVHYIDSNIKFKTCEEGGGKKRRKGERKLDFNFTIQGVSKDYNCEYHCKLEYFDGEYKQGRYYKDNRMYFGFYKPEAGKNKFLIAHLGGHL